ncbi:MAG: ROK family protein [Oscillospiraceae bacterium]|nr:ROK family protein [Oscillospiraceae bacterium]
MNILGIDIGGSKIAVGIIDKNGNVLCSEKEQLPAGTTSDSLLCVIKDKCNKISEKYNFDFDEIEKIGITIPGLADTKSGVWVYAPFSGISNFPIAEKINNIYGKKVYIENDVNACAVGEKRFGLCKDINDFIWITISNGIGGSVFINGGLYSGYSGNAGEIGHIKVLDGDNFDFKCGCGDYGCVEAVAAGPGIAKRYNNTTNNKNISAEQIAIKARNGDTIANKVMYDTGYYIGKALSAAINMLNPEMIIFGGGVSQSFDLIEPGIKDALSRYMFKAANKNIKLAQTALAYNAALIGAAAITFDI